MSDKFDGRTKIFYACSICGWRGEIFDMNTYKETYGLNYGYEEFDVCPRCGSEIEKLNYCAICGEPCFEEELTNKVCDCCGKENFNVDLGKQYLKNMSCELEFYSKAEGIFLKMNGQANNKWSEKLISIFEEAFDEAYKLNPENEEKRLKEYIFEDYEHYTGWLLDNIDDKSAA